MNKDNTQGGQIWSQSKVQIQNFTKETVFEYNKKKEFDYLNDLDELEESKEAFP
jgi:hypothetical protein